MLKMYCVIPFKWSSKPGKTDLWWFSSEWLLLGRGGVIDCSIFPGTEGFHRMWDFQGWNKSSVKKIRWLVTLEAVFLGKGHERAFWGAGNVQYLDMDSGYRNEYMSKNLSSSTCYICTFQCIGYTLIENLEKNSIFQSIKWK